MIKNSNNWSVGWLVRLFVGFYVKYNHVQSYTRNTIKENSLKTILKRCLKWTIGIFLKLNIEWLRFMNCNFNCHRNHQFEIYMAILTCPNLRLERTDGLAPNIEGFAFITSCDGTQWWVNVFSLLSESFTTYPFIL